MITSLGMTQTLKHLMPDITKECPKLFPMLMARALVGEGENKELIVLRRLMVFWVDKSVRKYSEARGYFVSQVDDIHETTKRFPEPSNQLYIFGFSDDIEDCLIVTRRLLHLLDKLKTMPDAKINRTVRKFIDAQSRTLIKSRDFLEHTVESLSTLPPDSSLLARVIPEKKGFQIGNHIVAFSDLAATLKTFHKVAYGLIHKEI